MKFTVLKGCEGFGDRLQCLLQAIEYSKLVKRTLVVDWRDEHWCHEENKGFDYYFRLNGIDTMTINEFIKYSRDKELSCKPEAWKTTYDKPNEIYDCYKTENSEGGDNKIWNRIIKGEAKELEEDIVVHSGTRARIYKASEFVHIKPQKWLAEYIKAHAKKERIERDEYNCIHLRAGSKPFMKARLEDINLRINMIKRWPTQSSYLAELHSEYKQLKDKGKRKELLLISDSTKLSKSWIDLYGEGKQIKQSCGSYSESSGIHLIKNNGANNINIARKETIIKETIRDFNILLNSNTFVHDKNSLFSKMATEIKSKKMCIVELN